MNKSKDKPLIIFSLVFLALCAALSIYATFNDISVSLALFSPQSKFAIGFEAFGQCVLWFMWGPLFSVLFLTRHTLEEYIKIFSKVLPLIKPIKNTDTKAYRILNTAVNCFTAVLFFVLCVIGWKKPIQNILKHMFDISEPVYIIVSAVIAAVGIILFSRMKKETLYRLEAVAAAALLLGILLKFAEKFKTVTHRVRFREMVAYSNGILDSNGLSHGSYTKLSPVLSKEMAESTDFSAFTRWYKIGNDMGKYAKADSFPSGHVMNSCAVFLLYLLVKTSQRLKKAAPFVLFVCAAYVFAMGISRIAAGAHYLTDVTFGILAGYCIFLISYKFHGYAEKIGCRI